MCSFFNKSKQAYYKQLKTVERIALQHNVILGLVQKKREIWKRGSGRNLHKSLNKEFAEHHIKIEEISFLIF